MGLIVLTVHEPGTTPERRRQLDHALEQNAAHAGVDEIIVFGGTPARAGGKVQVAPLRGKATYRSLFEHAASRARGRTCVVSDGAVALDTSTRYFEDVDFAQTALFFGGSRAVAFRAPLEKVTANLPLGAASAPALAAELVKAGYTVRDIGSILSATPAEAAGANPAAPQPYADGPRVIGVGLQRTGTASLRTALNILDIPTLEWFGAWFLVKVEDGRMRFSPSINHSYFQGFADSPVPLYFRELDAMFPGSRFVLTLRGKESWLRSVQELFRMKPEWDGTPEGEIYDAYHHATYGVTNFDREAFAAGFDRHNDDVRAYFKDRPQDLLVLDLSRQGQWEQLCPFLGKPIPRQAYPYNNRPPGIRGKIAKLLSGRRAASG